MTSPEVAEYLGVNVQRVRFLVKKGTIKAEKIGRDWLFNFSDVEQYKRNRPGPGRPRKVG